VKRPAGSFGSADASRVTATTVDAESDRDSDSVESIASGETTPPMNPTLHGRGGGAALRDPTMHAPVSVVTGSSAVCTVPERLNKVTDAGCGMLASSRCPEKRCTPSWVSLRR
jgi:hypothetical protein